MIPEKCSSLECGALIRKVLGMVLGSLRRKFDLARIWFLAEKMEMSGDARKKFVRK